VITTIRAHRAHPHTDAITSAERAAARTWVDTLWTAYAAEWFVLTHNPVKAPAARTSRTRVAVQYVAEQVAAYAYRHR
jgi:hypothetical protein